MPLEHELLELNVAYQNSLSINIELRERLQEFEQLVSDYQKFVAQVDVRYDIGAIRVAERDSLQQRAKELLG